MKLKNVFSVLAMKQMQMLLLLKLVEQLGILNHFHSLKQFVKLKVISVSDNVMYIHCTLDSLY